MRDGTNLRYSREKQKLAWQTRVKKVGFEGSTSKIVKYWNREMRELEHSSWRRFRSAEGWVKCDSSLCDRNETESRRPAVSRERRKTDVRAWLSDYGWLERAYCEIVGNEYGTLSTPSPPLQMVRTAWIFPFFSKFVTSRFRFCTAENFDWNRKNSLFDSCGYSSAFQVAAGDFRFFKYTYQKF